VITTRRQAICSPKLKRGPRPAKHGEKEAATKEEGAAAERDPLSVGRRRGLSGDSAAFCVQAVSICLCSLLFASCLLAGSRALASELQLGSDAAASPVVSTACRRRSSSTAANSFSRRSLLPRESGDRRHGAPTTWAAPVAVRFVHTSFSPLESLHPSSFPSRPEIAFMGQPPATEKAPAASRSPCHAANMIVLINSHHPCTSASGF